MQYYLFGFLMLAGCNGLHMFQPNSQRIQTRNWAPATQKPETKVYCYRTLGDPQCFSTPQLNRDHLLYETHEPSAPERVRDMKWFVGIDGEDYETTRG